MKVYKRFGRNRKIVLHSGTCLDLLNDLPNNSVALTITSPPYCMGKEYERTDTLADFISAHKQVLPEIVRVTKPGGSICWQVGYHVQDGAVTPLDYLVHDLLRTNNELVLRNRIIWSYGHGLHCAKRFSGRHETILWYTKGSDYEFHLDRIRVPQKYPGKRHYKGTRRGEFSCNPLGKNPSDVWEIPNVKANHVEKTSHPCQFPIGLVIRLIRALSAPGDVICDPFLGSGSTAIAAILEGRRFVGAELRPKYWRLAFQRVAQSIVGKIRYRPPETPVFVPTEETSITRNPFQTNGKGKNENKESSKEKNIVIPVPKRKAR